MDPSAAWLPLLAPCRATAATSPAAICPRPSGAIDGGRRRDRCVLLLDAPTRRCATASASWPTLLAELAPKLPAWLALLLTSRARLPRSRQPVARRAFRLDAEGSTDNTGDLRNYARGWLARPGAAAAAADADRPVIGARQRLQRIRAAVAVDDPTCASGWIAPLLEVRSPPPAVPVELLTAMFGGTRRPARSG